MTDTTPLTIIYSTGVDTSTTTRTTSVTTPVAIASTGSDTLTLNISEDAYLGDAAFTVTVNGVAYGGTLTATALESQNASQNFSIQGNFPAGPLTVAVNFVNDAFGIYSDGSLAGDRNLYVNSISINGVVTTENGYQNLNGARTYVVTAPASSAVLPTVGITAQTLADDTGSNATDLITTDGAVTLTGQVTGASGTTVEIFNGTTALGQASILAGGSWSFATTLGVGSATLHAVATDPAGNTATSAAEPTITVQSTTAPAITISAPLQIAGSRIVVLAGSVAGAAGTAVEIFNGAKALGAATVANGNWSYQTTLAAGSYNLSAQATDPQGNVSTAADPVFTVTTPATTNRVLGVDTSTTTRSVSNSTPVTIAAGGSDVIVLNIAEDAFLGDAQFTVSVNGVQHGGTQTATALHSQGASQAFTLAGNFGSGTLDISVDFLNESYVETSLGVMLDERILYVDSIGINGKTVTLNAVQRFGAKTYALAVPASVTAAAPTISITSQQLAKDTGASGNDLITSDGAITLTGLVTGAAGTTVKILNGTTVLGTATIANNAWSFSEVLPAGSYKLTAVATDPTGNTASSAAQPTVLVETALPNVTISSPTQAADSSTVSLSGTVAGAAGTSVTIFNGSTALGVASIANGSWSFSTALAAGSYSLSAVATDLAGNTQSAADPAFTVVQSGPSVAITAQLLADDSGVSATDNITNDGAVTLQGTVVGASGTIVEIFDGGTDLGDATIAGGGWRFATVLAAGSHSLSAVAVDPSNNRSSTPAEPTILVQTSPPGISISAPVQSAGSTAFTLSGTVSGLSGTIVEIFNGTTAIGAAVISNGGWHFTDDLGAGSFSLTAQATDPAGNTASASDAAATITAPTTAPSGVMSATAFLDTIGVDTHMAYTDGQYADVAMVIADLKYLGITQVRDGISNGVDANGNYNGSAPLATYLEMAQAGIKFTFIIEATSPAVIATALGLINQVEAAVPGSVTSIEGPNEINNDPITYGTLTGEPAALAAQAALYAAVKADTVLAGVPVDYFTGYGAGSDAEGPDPTTTPGLADDDTQHPYPNFGQAPAFWVSRAQALTNLTASDVATAPAIYTETGYTTNQVTPYVQEVYELDLLMDTASENIFKTYLYELLDAYAPGSPQGDDGWGLFDNSTAAKPAATALHNLTSILNDNGATNFTTTKLNYTLSGLASDGNAMVLEKSDGTYELVIWAEPQIFNVNTGVYTAAAAQNVTVSLAQNFGAIEVFDPTTGTAAIASYANASSVTISVTDHPIIIQLGGATTVAAAAPSVSITAETLTSDTGASATDGITSDGAVTLAGNISGPSGSVVEILDGTTVLGDAGISGSTWRFSTTLAAGTHSLHAAASDAAGTTTTAAAATIIVETAAPVITIAPPVQTENSSTVTMSGTVGASGSSVQVLNGSAVLGQATITNGAWRFTASLAAGSYNLSAVATDLAGNTASASDPAFTVAAIASTTSSGLTGDTSLVTYNWNPSVQLAGYLAAVANLATGASNASAIIATFGDSTTEGINADNTGADGALDLSYPADLTGDLATDGGVAVQNANFQGYDVDDGALSFVGSGFNATSAYSGLGVAGGNAITTSVAGQGVDWTLGAPVTANELTLNYFDSGNGSVTVQVTGAAGSTTKTLAIGNSGNMASQTIALPLGSYSAVSIISNTANSTYIEGASFTNTVNPSIQLYNVGTGGAWSSAAGTGALTGNGEFPGGLALKPNLVLLDYGINDIVNQVLTPAQTVANYAIMIAESRAVGADPVIVIPNPFGLNPYLTTPQITTLAQVTTGLQALAIQQNVGIIDLNQTYGASFATLSADNLLNSPHPDAALYADMAARIAALLTNDVSATFPNTASYVVAGGQTVTGTSGNDILFGASTSNLLIGNGGSDSYVINANDVTDTIQNGASASNAPAGQIEFAAATHDQLWFSQSGNNLSIQILGTAKTVVVDNWETSGSAQVAEIIGSDGYKIDTGLQSLVQAMASFAAANAGFNPQTTASTNLANSAFASLATAVQADWHH